MTEKQGRSRGRPEYEPTEKDHAFVTSMTMAGVQQEHIAKVIGVDKKTLRKHFRDDLDHGRTRANAHVVANLYRQATKNDPRATTAAIYWTKAQMGWRETSQLEHTGRDGGPIQTEDVSARDRISGRIARLAAGNAAGGDTGEPD